MEQSLLTLKNCPSCGNSSFSNHLSATDYTYSKDVFPIVKCVNCSLAFTNPIPSESEIGKYYDNPEYVSHTDTKKGLLFSIYSLVKTHALKQKRLLLEHYSTSRTVLDYGAGTGDFSAELANNNWQVTSFEPDDNARGKISSKSNAITIANSLETLVSDSFSCVTLWHVLEHVHRLKETLGHFNRLLSDNGTLVIAVPNHNSFDANYYKSNWAAYDVPRHLYHFDYESMKTLIESQGFELKTIKPMWFDSTYVSLLSEKNQNAPSILNSIIGWIRATIIGAVSNLVALGNPKKGSSIIYVFKKAK